MENVLNIDPSAQLHIKGIRTGHSFAFTLDFFEDDNTTPKAVPPSPKLTLYYDVKRTHPYRTLDESLGLTIPPGNPVSNRLQVSLSRTQNDLNTGTLHYAITSDVDSNNSVEFLNGTWEVAAGR